MPMLQSRPWGIRTRILLTLLGLCLMISSCQSIRTVSGEAEYIPVIPDRPRLQMPPEEEACETQTGQKGSCVTFWFEDFQQIRAWYLQLEQELKASCLYIVGDPKKCRTE